MNMYIKSLGNNTVDAFVGKGWNNWLRVRITGNVGEVVQSSFVPKNELVQQVVHKVNMFHSHKRQPKGVVKHV